MNWTFKNEIILALLSNSIYDSINAIDPAHFLYPNRVVCPAFSIPVETLLYFGAHRSRDDLGV